ncbi:hypothetical protein [Thiothrix subterranea]
MSVGVSSVKLGSLIMAGS